MKSFNDFIGSLFTSGLDAELPQQVPVPRAGSLRFTGRFEMASTAFSASSATLETLSRRNGRRHLDPRFQNRRD